jgi:hypothetical protein
MQQDILEILWNYLQLFLFTTRADSKANQTKT